MKQISLQFLLLVVVSDFRSGYAAFPHELRVSRSATFPTTPTFKSDPATLDKMKRTDSFFTQASQVCAFGMWALYNVSNFGEGFETSTTVQVVRGFDPQACASTAAYPALKSVQSVHWLGFMNRDEPGITIYSEQNFLGGLFAPATPAPATPLTPLSKDIDAIRLGSLAITGTGRWRLCGDANCLSAICIDMSKYRGGFFFNRNVIGDKSAPWPAYIRALVYNPLQEDCDSDASPPIVVPKGVLARAGKPVLEIF